MKYNLAHLHLILVVGAVNLPVIAQNPTAAPASVKEGAVLAQTARVTITKSDLDAELMRIPERERGEFIANRGRLGGMVDNVLVNKTLALEARQNGLDKDPKIRKEIEASIDHILAKARTQEFYAGIKVPDLTASAREEYLLNSQRFKYPAQYKLWHVLLRGEAQSKVLAKAKAERVREAVIAGGDLEKIARENSDDSTAAKNGGFNRLVPITSINPAVTKMLETMKAGDVAPLIEVADGYFVMKVVEVVPERKPTFDEIKIELLHEAKLNHLAAQFRTYVEAIKNDKTLRVNTEALDEIRQPFLPNLDLIQPEVPAPAPTKGK